MTSFGLTLSSEEHPPRKLVDIAIAAETAEFDFVSISDHFHPWIGEQGHSPFVWTVLGAIAVCTTQIEVGVGVSCPSFRMSPGCERRPCRGHHRLPSRGEVHMGGRQR